MDTKNTSKNQAKVIGAVALLVVILVSVLVWKSKNGSKSDVDPAGQTAESVNQDPSIQPQNAASETETAAVGNKVSGEAKVDGTEGDAADQKDSTEKLAEKGSSTNVAVVGADKVSGDQKPSDQTSQQTAADASQKSDSQKDTAAKSGGFFGGLKAMFGFGGSKDAKAPVAGATTDSEKSVDGKVAAVGAQDAAPAATPAPPEKGCFRVSYQEQKGKVKGPHRNFLRLAHKEVNLKSVCVRVNGTPVKYEYVQERGKKEMSGFMLGALTKTSAQVTVQYCLNNNDCPSLAKQDCKIPKDEFMDAIGGAEEDTRIQVVKWDPKDTTNNTDVAAEIDSDLKKELAETDLPVSDDWSANPEKLSCSSGKSQHQASASSATKG